MFSDPRLADRRRLPERLLDVCLALVAGGVSAVLSTSAALAQPIPEPPAGSIIYIRDVPDRQAQLPGQPGKPDYIDAGPDEMIVGTTGLGLKPLTDEQQSSVSAPLQRLPGLGPLPTENWAAADIGATGRQAAGAGAVERAPGMLGSTVNNGVSQVTSALSAVSGTLEGPR